MKQLLIITLILSATFSVHAQKNLAKGDRLFDQNKFEDAIPYYQKEIEEGKGKVKNAAMAKLAECYRLSNQLEAAEEAYKKLLKVAKKDLNNLFNYAQALKSAAKYAEAKKEFLNYTALNPKDPKGMMYAISCDSAQSWLDNPSTNEVREVKFVNTTDREFSPTFYKEGIVFASSREGSKTSFIRVGEGSDEVKLDLYYEKITGSDETTVPPAPLSPVNTTMHEGPCSFSKDGNLLYITRTVAGQRVKGEIINTLQILTSRSTDGKVWTSPVSDLPFNSSQYSVGHPTLSADGRFLFFISDMQGGQGGTDLYFSWKQKDGTWSAPKNLGVDVNTFGYELFPFISDNFTLYFSSNGLPGMGKLDVFSCRFDTATKKCSKPLNLKPPINSIWDDFGLIAEASGEKGFFSSNRYNGTGGDDIYAFAETKPLQITIDGGKFVIEDKSVYDAIKYKLVDDDTKIEEFLTSSNGKYTIEVKPGKKYILLVRKEGFANNKIGLSVNRKKDGEVLTATVTPVNQPVRLNGFLKTATVGMKAPNDTSQTPPPVTETPLEKVVVKVFNAGREIAFALSGKDGAYSLGELKEKREYRIIADKNFVYAPESKKEESEPIKYEAPAPVAEKPAAATSEMKKIKCDGLVKSGANIISNTDVQLLKGDMVVGNTQSNMNGQFNFEVMMGEKYTVKANKDGFYSTTENVNVPATAKEGMAMTVAVEMNLKPKEKLKLNGVVKSGSMVLEGTQIQLMKGGKIVEEIATPKNGSFSFQIYQDEQYNVLATQKGFFQKDMLVSTAGKTAKDVVPLEMKLDKIEMEKTIEVKNIYYDLNSSNLRADATSELDNLAKFLEVNPNVAIELSSHTDSRGNDDDNMKLSQKRADAAADYLSSKNISRKRIIAKGYGKTKLIMPTAVTEDDHQKNRRTEFKVVDTKVKEEAPVPVVAVKKEEPKPTPAPVMETKKEEPKKEEPKLAPVPAPAPKPTPVAPTPTPTAVVPPVTAGNGVVFKIQVAASKSILPSDHSLYKKVTSKIETEKGEDGMYRYYTGSFAKFEEADATLKSIKAGGGDGFITAFKDGKKITVAEAKTMTK